MIITTGIITKVLHLFFECNFIINIALFFLALHLADFFLKIIWDSWPGPLLTNLQDKAVLITGCDTGFGNRFARELDAKGVTVFAGCLHAEGPDAMNLKEKCSERLHILQLDVTKDDQVENAVKSVKKILAGKDLWAVVNNAGIGIIGEAEFLSLKSIQKQTDVNCFGVIRVTKAFLPLLKKSKGRIVIVSSLVGRLPFPMFAGYCTSKFATTGYAECLRKDLMRYPVTVHLVEPWHYRTNFTNLDMVRANTMNELERTSETLREEYDEEYVAKFMKYSRMFVALARPESAVGEVSSCMMDAAIGRFPKNRYVPGIFGKIGGYVLLLVPTCVVDLISYILYAIYMKN